MNRYQIYYLVGIGLLMAGAVILALFLYNWLDGIRQMRSNPNSAPLIPN